MSVGYGASRRLETRWKLMFNSEHVDAATLAKRGLRLGYTPDVLNDAVADISVMLALMSVFDLCESSG